MAKYSDIINYTEPQPIKKGDLIGITAPSSQIDPRSVSAFVRLIESMGYEVILGETITSMKDRDYNSGTISERYEDLNAMLKNREIRAIFAGAGGFGAQVTAQAVDYDAIKADPKPIIGFSDTTFLLNAITGQTGVRTFLGPTAEVVNVEADKPSLELCMKFISGQIDGGFVYSNFDGSLIRRISQTTKYAQGPIIGGNLTMVQTTLGTPYQVDTKGKILVLEETGESSYSIERSIEHMFSAGMFDGCAAVVFGEFSNIQKEPVESARDSSPSIYEILVKKFKAAEYPVLIGYNFSHGTFNLTIPLGRMGKVNNKSREFILL